MNKDLSLTCSKTQLNLLLNKVKMTLVWIKKEICCNLISVALLPTKIFNKFWSPLILQLMWIFFQVFTIIIEISNFLTSAIVVGYVGKPPYVTQSNRHWKTKEQTLDTFRPLTTIRDIRFFFDNFRYFVELKCESETQAKNYIIFSHADRMQTAEYRLDFIYKVFSKLITMNHWLQKTLK